MGKRTFRPLPLFYSEELLPSLVVGRDPDPFHAVTLRAWLGSLVGDPLRRVEAPRLDDVAVVGVSDGSRAAVACLPGQTLKIASHRIQRGDPLGDLGRVSLDEAQDMGTRCLHSIPERQNLFDLAQAETHGLGRTDEPEPPFGAPVRVTITRGRPGRRWYQADPLVLADRLRRDATLLREGTDPHGP